MVSSSYFHAAPGAPARTRFEVYLDALQRFGMHPGLERIRALLAAAGDPQAQYPIVLVGGTNGKGSTCEFLAQSLAATYGPIGLYTSPHLYRWNERIRVLEAHPSGSVAPCCEENLAAGQSPFAGTITDSDLDALFEDSLPHLKAVAHQYGRPTEFETLTFMGLWHFARTNGAAAVVEVGLGGRWDATNVTDPIVSVITHVALDHCERLGNTVEEIAADKVQIARPGRVLVTAETRESVLAVFRAHCDTIGTRLWPFRAAHLASAEEQPELRKCLEFVDAQHKMWSCIENMPDFQVVNARTAAVACWAMGQQSGQLPGTLPAPRRVPGRAEEVHNSPTIVLDGSNNPDGAARLAEHLQAHYKGRKLIFVTGISADKDYPAMLALWTPLAHTFIATQANHPRAAAAALIASEARRHGATVEAIPTIREAISRAVSIAAPNDVVCICGSFFLLAEADRGFITSLPTKP